MCAQLLCSCKTADVNTLKELNDIKNAFSASLTSVSVYTSSAEEGEAEHIDQGLIAAFFGKDGTFPPEMSGVDEYSFFCASSVGVCEVWIASCRTYSAARALSHLFEERRLYLSKIDFDSDTDAMSAERAQVILKGKRVYFICTPCADDIAAYLNEKS